MSKEDKDGNEGTSVSETDHEINNNHEQQEHEEKAQGKQAYGDGSDPSFSPGTTAYFTGLVNAPQLNGTQGILEDYDDMKGRYNVMSKEFDKTVSVKPSNISHLRFVFGSPSSGRCLFHSPKCYKSFRDKIEEMKTKVIDVLESIAINDCVHESKVGELMEKLGLAYSEVEHGQAIKQISDCHGNINKESFVRWFLKLSFQDDNKCGRSDYDMKDTFQSMKGKVDDVRKMLVSFYEVWNPSKLSQVEKLLVKYAGDEDILLCRIAKKYCLHPSFFDMHNSSGPFAAFCRGRNACDNEYKSRFFKDVDGFADTITHNSDILFSPGTFVSFTGLINEPELNGTQGTVQGYDKEKERYIVMSRKYEKTISVKACKISKWIFESNENMENCTASNLSQDNRTRPQQLKRRMEQRQRHEELADDMKNSPVEHMQEVPKSPPLHSVTSKYMGKEETGRGGFVFCFSSSYVYSKDSSENEISSGLEPTQCQSNPLKSDDSQTFHDAHQAKMTSGVSTSPPVVMRIPAPLKGKGVASDVRTHRRMSSSESAFPSMAKNSPAPFGSSSTESDSTTSSDRLDFQMSSSASAFPPMPKETASPLGSSAVTTNCKTSGSVDATMNSTASAFPPMPMQTASPFGSPTSTAKSGHKNSDTQDGYVPLATKSKTNEDDEEHASSSPLVSNTQLDTRNHAMATTVDHLSCKTETSSTDSVYKSSTNFDISLNSRMAQLQDKIAKINLDRESIDKRREILMPRKKLFEEAKVSTDVSGADIFKLNVRGKELYARRDTLTVVKGSRLAKLFGGYWDDRLLRDDDGYVFLDVDPTLFVKLLEYLYMIKLTSNSKDGHEIALPQMDERDKERFLDLLDFFAVNLKDKNPKGTSNTVPGKKSTSSSPTYKKHDTHIDEDSIEREIIKDMEANVTHQEKEFAAEEYFKKFFTVKKDETNKIKKEQSNPVCPTKDSRIINLFVLGDIISLQQSTLCALPGNHLARNFSNDEWLAEHTVVSKDKTVCILLEIPADFVKSFIKLLDILVIGKKERAAMTCYNDAEFRQSALISQCLSLQAFLYYSPTSEE